MARFDACTSFGVEDFPRWALGNALAAAANLGAGVPAAATVERVKVRTDAGSLAAVAFATIQLRRALRAGKLAVLTTELEAGLPCRAAPAVKAKAILLAAAHPIHGLMTATDLGIAAALSFGKALNADRIRTHA